MKGEKRERIIRTLLEEPTGSLSAYRISKKTECSEQWVGSYLKKLESKNLVKHTKVTDIVGLFTYWISIRAPPKYAEYHLQKDPLTIIKNQKCPYALTTYQADRLTQNYLFPTRTDIYILEEDLKYWHKAFLSNGLVGPGNTRILIADEHIIKNAKKKQGYLVVSNPQVICDLLMEGGSAVDAAHLLLKRWYHESL